MHARRERSLTLLLALYLIIVVITPRTFVMRIVVAILLLLGSIAFACGADLPDATKTPGLADPALTKEVICKAGWSTKSVRNVPASLKRKVYKAYGLKGNHTGYCTGKQGCEIDHLISLEIGGANDLKNLWPEPFSGTTWNAHIKDKYENLLHKLICSGTITLKEAQSEISANWIEGYKKRLGEPTPNGRRMETGRRIP